MRHGVHGHTPTRSNNSRAVSTWYRFASFPGGGRWHRHCSPTHYPGCFALGVKTILKRQPQGFASSAGRRTEPDSGARTPAASGMRLRAPQRETGFVRGPSCTAPAGAERSPHQAGSQCRISALRPPPRRQDVIQIVEGSRLALAESHWCRMRGYRSPTFETDLRGRSATKIPWPPSPSGARGPACQSHRPRPAPTARRGARHWESGRRHAPNQPQPSRLARPGGLRTCRRRVCVRGGGGDSWQTSMCDRSSK